MCHNYSNCTLDIMYKRDKFFNQLNEEIMRIDLKNQNLGLE